MKFIGHWLPFHICVKVEIMRWEPDCKFACKFKSRCAAAILTLQSTNFCYVVDNRYVNIKHWTYAFRLCRELMRRYSFIALLQSIRLSHRYVVVGSLLRLRRDKTNCVKWVQLLTSYISVYVIAVRSANSCRDFTVTAMSYLVNIKVPTHKYVLIDRNVI